MGHPGLGQHGGCMGAVQAALGGDEGEEAGHPEEGFERSFMER